MSCTSCASRHVIGPARDRSRAGDGNDRRPWWYLRALLTFTGRQEPTTELRKSHTAQFVPRSCLARSHWRRQFLSHQACSALRPLLLPFFSADQLLDPLASHYCAAIFLSGRDGSQPCAAPRSCLSSSSYSRQITEAAVGPSSSQRCKRSCATTADLPLPRVISAALHPQRRTAAMLLPPLPLRSCRAFPTCGTWQRRARASSQGACSDQRVPTWQLGTTSGCCGSASAFSSW